MGVVIESPRIAAALSQALDRRDMVFEVNRSTEGPLIWRERTPDGEEILHATEPHANLLRRTFASLARWLPLEWIL